MPKPMNSKIINILQILLILLIAYKTANASNIDFVKEINHQSIFDRSVNDKYINSNSYYEKYQEDPITYDQENLEQEARLNAKNDQNAKMLKKFYATNKIEFRGDESFLANHNKILANQKNIVNINHQNCQNVEVSCNNYIKPTIQSCESQLLNKDYGNHIFSCNQHKKINNKDCSEINEYSCQELEYGLPDSSEISLPNFKFSNNILTYKTPNRMGHNCAGYNYYWRFNLVTLENFEELKFLWASADDRTLIYVNDNLVHNYPNSGCERGRTFYSAPNIDLKPYLKLGQNTILVKIIVGGRGEGRGAFSVKYKKCTKLQNVVIDNCQILQEDKNCKKTSEKFCSKIDDEYYVMDKKIDECLEYKTSYQCIDEHYDNDKCHQFSIDTKCAIHSNNCEIYDQNFNQCLKKISKYECDYQKEFEDYDGISYELGADNNILNYDKSNCQKFIDDYQSCSLSSKECLLYDSANICHKYRNNYLCRNNEGSICNKLRNKCQLKQSKCTYHNNNECQISQDNYLCPSLISNITQGSDIILCDMNNQYQDDQKEENNFSEALAKLEILEEAGNDFSNDPLSIFSGNSNSCEQDKSSYSNCCKNSGWGQDIGSSNCSYNEKQLTKLNQNKQCIYLGSHCSKKVLGQCVKDQLSFCCYKSKIAKIIQEQGKSQLSKSFGSSKSPNCSGLTESDIENIDFSKMDFSEIIPDVLDQTTPQDSQQFEELAKDKIKKFFDKFKND